MEESEKQTQENKGKEQKDTEGTPDKGNQPKTPTLYERTNDATERLENANAKTEELLNRQEKLYETQKLSGEGGGRVEPTVVSEEQVKVNSAAEYFKDTQLEKDIKKANE